MVHMPPTVEEQLAKYGQGTAPVKPTVAMTFLPTPTTASTPTAAPNAASSTSSTSGGGGAPPVMSSGAAAAFNAGWSYPSANQSGAPVYFSAKNGRWMSM
eukprot:PhM_4_TR4497/c0_g1_i1/m.61782